MICPARQDCIRPPEVSVADVPPDVYAGWSLLSLAAKIGRNAGSRLRDLKVHDQTLYLFLLNSYCLENPTKKVEVSGVCPQFSLNHCHYCTTSATVARRGPVAARQVARGGGQPPPTGRLQSRSCAVANAGQQSGEDVPKVKMSVVFENGFLWACVPAKCDCACAGDRPRRRRGGGDLEIPF